MSKPSLEVFFRDQLLRTVPVDGPETSIGRHAENQVAVEDVEVSRRHARILMVGDGFVLEDLDSANGTFLNGRKIAREELSPGDEISVGGHALRFRLLDLEDRGGGRDSEGRTEVRLSEGARAARAGAPSAGDPVGEMVLRGRSSGAGCRPAAAGGPPQSRRGEAASVSETGGEASPSGGPGQAATGAVEDKFGPGLRIFQGRSFLFEAIVPEAGLAIGRSSNCQLVLRGDDVSRTHARIVQYDRGRFEIQDAGSRNGTFVNGARATRRSLDEGDEIRIGGFRLLYCALPRCLEADGRTTTSLAAPSGRRMRGEEGSEEGLAGDISPALAAGDLRGGTIEVTRGGCTYTFALAPEDAAVAKATRNREEEIRVKLVVDEGMLEGRVALSEMKKAPGDDESPE